MTKIDLNINVTSCIDNDFVDREHEPVGLNAPINDDHDDSEDDSEEDEDNEGRRPALSPPFFQVVSRLQESKFSLEDDAAFFDGRHRRRFRRREVVDDVLGQD